MKQDIAKELRKAIADANKRGITRGAIADKAGLRRSQLTRIATGENLPRLDTAAKIAAALGFRLTLTPIAK